MSAAFCPMRKTEKTRYRRPHSVCGGGALNTHALIVAMVFTEFVDLGTPVVTVRSAVVVDIAAIEPIVALRRSVADVCGLAYYATQLETSFDVSRGIVRGEFPKQSLMKSPVAIIPAQRDAGTQGGAV